MGFANYGVLIGTKTRYYRDQPDSQGKYYHGNIEVMANGNTYRCAIDVDSQRTRVQWRIINLSAKDMQQVIGKSDGWHHLLSNDNSGAIDYIRWKPMWVTIRIPLLLIPKWRIRIPLPPWIRVAKLKQFVRSKTVLNALFRLFYLEQSSFWLIGDNIDAIEQLESVINQGTKVFIFGEAFDSGYGVHNIHQNQGDPPNIPQSADNAIWQDGATIVQKPDGSFVGFFNKFETQSFKTDSSGRPI